MFGALTIKFIKFNKFTPWRSVGLCVFTINKVNSSLTEYRFINVHALLERMVRVVCDRMGSFNGGKYFICP